MAVQVAGACRAWYLRTPLLAEYARCMLSCMQRHGDCGRRRATGMRFVRPLARRHGARGRRYLPSMRFLRPLTRRHGDCGRRRAQGMRFVRPLVRAGMATADAVARRVRALHAILYAKAGRLRTPLLAGYALCMHYCTQRQGACCRWRAPRMRFVCTLVRAGMALADAIARRACALYALLCTAMALADAVASRVRALSALLRAGIALADTHPSIHAAEVRVYARKKNRTAINATRAALPAECRPRNL